MDTSSDAENGIKRFENEPKKSALSTIRALHLVSLKDFDHERAWARYCNAIFRGAATGFCLRGGLHLLKFIFSIILRRKRSPRTQPVSDMMADTLRYTGFLGAFAGIFVSVDEGIAALFGKERCVDLSMAVDVLTKTIGSPNTSHQPLLLNKVQTLD